MVMSSLATFLADVWAFHSAGVSIVHPDETCSIERTFSTDNEGSFLPNSWFDGALAPLITSSVSLSSFYRGLYATHPRKPTEIMWMLMETLTVITTVVLVL
jgi:hypothetical protein